MTRNETKKRMGDNNLRKNVVVAAVEDTGDVTVVDDEDYYCSHCSFHSADNKCSPHRSSLRE